MREISVKIKRLHADAIIPQYATVGAAGFDLVAVEDVVIEPGATALVKTGLAVALPPGYEMQIRPRSGISLRTKLRIANSPATIDADYRGEIGVIIENIAERKGVNPAIARKLIDGSDDLRGSFIENVYLIRKGDRIAQAVIAEVPRAEFTEVDTLDDTERGVGGFGSTGVGTYDDAELDAIRPEVSE